jgi:glycosyltransferase involved in cell wall biosynthesis
MKVAYVSYKDARDIRAWSGTEHHMAKCLADRGNQIDYICPLQRPFTPVNFAYYLLATRLLGKNDMPHRDRGFLRACARQVEERLKASDASVVLGHGALPQSYIRTRLPMAVWTDATFAQMIGYYPNFTNLTARTIRNGHESDRALLERCDLVILSSQWAINSAVKDYGISPSKLRLLSFGANVPDTRSRTDVERLIDARPPSPVRLLLVGVHWLRKGADLASEVAAELARRGVPVRLDVIGCTPPEGSRVPDCVTLHGFISKASPEGAARIERFFSEAHFFIVPSRADCTPIVFCEAASFGLPVLSRATGGIPSVITDGVNGMCFPDGAPPAAYADYIQRTMETPGAYRALCLSSFEEYRGRLNWRVAGEKLEAMLAGIAAR